MIDDTNYVKYYLKCCGSANHEPLLLKKINVLISFPQRTYIHVVMS